MPGPYSYPPPPIDPPKDATRGELTRAAFVFSALAGVAGAAIGTVLFPQNRKVGSQIGAAFASVYALVYAWPTQTKDKQWTSTIG